MDVVSFGFVAGVLSPMMLATGLLIGGVVCAVIRSMRAQPVESDSLEIVAVNKFGVWIWLDEMPPTPISDSIREAVPQQDLALKP